MTYQISNSEIEWLIVIAIWDLIWRGFALWRAAGRRQTAWFVVMLIVNSVGILPIIYLLLNEPSAQKKSKVKD